VGSAQQLVQLLAQLLLARRPKSPRRRGFAQQAGSAQHAGSAAQQAGSAAQQAGSAAQHGSAAQVGAQSQQARLRRPAAEAESAATKPTTIRTAHIVTNEERLFIENSFEERPNRIAIRWAVDSVARGQRTDRLPPTANTLSARAKIQEVENLCRQAGRPMVHEKHK
jgi:hypothetical protein